MVPDQAHHSDSSPDPTGALGPWWVSWALVQVQLRAPPHREVCRGGRPGRGSSLTPFSLPSARLVYLWT